MYLFLFETSQAEPILKVILVKIELIIIFTILDKKSKKVEKSTMDEYIRYYGSYEQYIVDSGDKHDELIRFLIQIKLNNEDLDKTVLKDVSNMKKDTYIKYVKDLINKPQHVGKFDIMGAWWNRLCTIMQNRVNSNIIYKNSWIARTDMQKIIDNVLMAFQHYGKNIEIAIRTGVVQNDLVSFIAKDAWNKTFGSNNTPIRKDIFNVLMYKIGLEIDEWQCIFDNNPQVNCTLCGGKKSYLMIENGTMVAVDMCLSPPSITANNSNILAQYFDYILSIIVMDVPSELWAPYILSIMHTQGVLYNLLQLDSSYSEGTLLSECMLYEGNLLSTQILNIFVEALIGEHKAMFLLKID